MYSDLTIYISLYLFAGDMFNKFANWTEWDNNTGIIYETWTVRKYPGKYTGSL